MWGNKKRNCHCKSNKYFFVLCRKALSNVVWQWYGIGKSSELRNLSTSLSISRVHTHTHTHTHAWECINVKRRQGPLSFFSQIILTGKIYYTRLQKKHALCWKTAAVLTATTTTCLATACISLPIKFIIWLKHFLLPEFFPLLKRCSVVY